MNNSFYIYNYNMSSKFSILIANYNNSEYIFEAILSVLNQTYKNWEIIIVDDASTDNSIEVITPFLSDKRIKLIQHDKNLGCGTTKRDCVVHASGEIMGELDPDDTLDKNAISIMIDYHNRHADHGLIYSSNYECDENLTIMQVLDWVGEVERDKTNLHKIKTSAFRAFKRDFYLKTDGFDPNLQAAVDRDLVYKLEEVGKILFLDKPLYFYRRQKRGISYPDNSIKAEIGKLSCFLAKYSAYQRRLESGFCNLNKSQMSTLMLEILPTCLKLKNKNYFFQFLFEAIKLKPFNLRGYFLLLFRLLKFPIYRFYKIILKIWGR